jgi:hypothetical protein
MLQQEAPKGEECQCKKQPRMQEEENKKDGWIKSKWCKNKDEGARQKLRLLR